MIYIPYIKAFDKFSSGLAKHAFNGVFCPMNKARLRSFSIFYLCIVIFLLNDVPF